MGTNRLYLTVQSLHLRGTSSKPLTGRELRNYHTSILAWCPNILPKKQKNLKRSIAVGIANQKLHYDAVKSPGAKSTCNLVLY